MLPRTIDAYQNAVSDAGPVGIAIAAVDAPRISRNSSKQPKARVGKRHPVIFSTAAAAVAAPFRSTIAVIVAKDSQFGRSLSK